MIKTTFETNEKTVNSNMNPHYEKVLNYVVELGYTIAYQDDEESIIMIDDHNSGINQLVLGIATPLLIMEQFILELKNPTEDVYKQLLQKNRDIIHGAFVIDESGKKIIFRDTLQIENLDLNELEGSLNSLALLMSEYSTELINFSKN